MSTLTLPMDWATYIKTDFNEPRNPETYPNAFIGWEYSQSFVPIIKFDVSQMSVIPIGSIITAIIYFRVGNVGPAFTESIPCTLHELIKPATANAQWSKYDNITNWTSPGASGDGTDYKSSIIGNFTITSGFTWYSLSVGGQIMRSLQNTNRPIIIFPPSPNPSTLSYCEFYTGYSSTEYYPYIDLTYKPSGLVGDATIF